MSSTARAVSLSALTSLVVSTATLAIGLQQLSTPSQELSPLPLQEIATPGTKSEDLAAQEMAIVRAVEKAEPAVVSIIISKDLPILERTSEVIPFDPFFDVPFRLEIPRLRQRGTQRREVGGGTAFFVESDGLLMTNKHVVSDPDAEYTALLNDGRRLAARVVARDPINDIALLKVDGKDFPSLALAASDDLKLGQTVIAIGNALAEFRNTVSVGVISGLQRTITAGNLSEGISERLSRIIQTDAAINQGNSGGPLLDSRGDVIGMNTAVAGGAQNIGFAIPVSDLRRALASYEKHGRILRPYLGLRYAVITPELKKRANLSYDHGVLVVRGEESTDLAVLPGSPAEKAGLQENDIILEVDGLNITETFTLGDALASKLPGETITLKIVHRGAEKTVKVTLGEWKEE